MNDDKLAFGTCTGIFIFNYKKVHPGRDNLIVETKLIPRIAVGFAFMFNSLN